MFVVSVETTDSFVSRLFLTMNTPTKYMYVMQPAGLAGAPMFAAYAIQTVAERSSEFEVARARQAMEASQDINSNETVNPVIGLSQAVWRFAAKSVRRKPTTARVAA